MSRLDVVGEENKCKVSVRQYSLAEAEAMRPIIKEVVLEKKPVNEPTEPCPIDLNAPQFITIDASKELRCPGYIWRRYERHPSNPFKWQRCNRLLGKGEPGTIEIKCPKCGLLCRFRQL